MTNHPGLVDGVMKALVFVEKYLPPGENFSFNRGGGPYYTVSIVRHTQATARELMHALPHAFWKKSYDKDLKWWTMAGIFDGVKIRIYGIDDTPPTCRIVKKIVKKMERVPVAFEDREVETEVNEVICDPDPETIDQPTEGAADVTA